MIAHSDAWDVDYDWREWARLYIIDEVQEKPKKNTPNPYRQQKTWKHIQGEHRKVKVKTDRLGDFG
jgi:hypothetical protein